MGAPALRAPDAAHVRLRLPGRRPGPLPGRVGLDPLAIGAVLTLTLVGDTLISLWLTTNADRLGRRRVLVAGAVLMLFAGDRVRLTSWVPLLILAGAIGVISPTGNEVGPFLAVEQAALTQIGPGPRRTATFAWYNLVGYVATATGRAGGRPRQPGADRPAASPRADAYRAVVDRLRAHRAGSWRSGPAGSTPRIEAPPARLVARRDPRRRFGLGRSKAVVLQPVRPVLARCLRRRASSRRA